MYTVETVEVLAPSPEDSEMVDDNAHIELVQPQQVDAVHQPHVFNAHHRDVEGESNNDVMDSFLENMDEDSQDDDVEDDEEDVFVELSETPLRHKDSNRRQPPGSGGGGGGGGIIKKYIPVIMFLGCMINGADASSVGPSNGMINVLFSSVYISNVL